MDWRITTTMVWICSFCICCALMVCTAETDVEVETECMSSDCVNNEDRDTDCGIREIRTTEPTSLENISTTNEVMRTANTNNEKITLLIPPDYSIHDPPPLTKGNPVPVQFSVSIKNIPELNELKQMLSIEMNLRIYWQDTRLLNGSHTLFEQEKRKTSHNYISFNQDILSKIWVPDVYSDYAKHVTSQEILRRPLSIRLYPNATVRYSARIMTELSCPMDFKMYPKDTQRCDMRLESYGFTRNELAFSWKHEGRVLNIDHRLAHFDFDVNLIDERGDVNFMSGSYPAIYLCLRLHRRLSYHLLQTYVPSSLFIIITWLSFLIPVEYATGRLAICMTLLLTLTAMFGAVRSMTPSVSYIKALDIWMVGCIVFVFLALAEFAFVLRLDKIMKLMKDRAQNSSEEYSNVNWDTLKEQGNDLKIQNWNETESSQEFERGVSGQVKYEKRKTRVPFESDSLIRFRRCLEFISACLSPVIFIVFNLIYWPWLMYTVSPNSIC